MKFRSISRASGYLFVVLLIGQVQICVGSELTLRPCIASNLSGDYVMVTQTTKAPKVNARRTNELTAAHAEQQGVIPIAEMQQNHMDPMLFPYQVRRFNGQAGMESLMLNHQFTSRDLANLNDPAMSSNLTFEIDLDGTMSFVHPENPDDKTYLRYRMRCQQVVEGEPSAHLSSAVKVNDLLLTLYKNSGRPTTTQLFRKVARG